MASTLIAKIAKASQAVGALQPDKTNTQQNYQYISADKILDRAGDALAKEGVVILPSIVHEETAQTDYTDNYGKAKTRFDAVVHFAMIVSDGESQFELPWRGRGNDYAVPDKAMYKAITSGHKYFIAKLLNIGVGNEDGEHESEPQPQAATRTPPKRPTLPAEEVFDKPAKTTPRANASQLAAINELGKQAYGDEWDGNKEKLAEWSSQGARQKLVDLYEMEAAKLIKALEKKVAA